jgi:alkylhydroperoxidase/carboxymuconolactone decarboxylase family protein YurZ
MSNPGTLTKVEKAQVALSAAMGAGCRTCADNLYPVLRSFGAGADEIEPALDEGLRTRRATAALMQSKADALVGRTPAPDVANDDEIGSRLSELMRIGAGVAANSAPTVLHHLKRARSVGATEQEIGLAIGIARLVRSKAQGFSDAEIDEACAKEASGAQVPEVPCPLDAVTASDPRAESGCCS